MLRVSLWPPSSYVSNFLKRLSHNELPLRADSFSYCTCTLTAYQSQDRCVEGTLSVSHGKSIEYRMTDHYALKFTAELVRMDEMPISPLNTARLHVRSVLNNVRRMK